MSDTKPEPTNESLQKTITELEKATQILVRRDLDLKRAYRQLEEMDERKSEFVSIAAHQLRTPLSAIRWAHQMLLAGEAGELSGEQNVILLQAQQSIVKMIGLVNDLLNADHLEYDKVLFNHQSVNLDQAILEVVSELRPMAQGRFITISTDLDSNKKPIHCDVSRIKEAFLNVLNNAIKYSFPKTDILIKSRAEGDHVLVSVTDHGIGIPEKYHTHIFEKFTRADNAQRIDADGSGLGMFISRKIVEAHGGKISFTSSENEGTSFYIELPTH
jgi:signal transduction histidine kinase